jgi:hypothetical protein
LTKLGPPGLRHAPGSLCPPLMALSQEAAVMNLTTPLANASLGLPQWLRVSQGLSSWQDTSKRTNPSRRGQSLARAGPPQMLEANGLSLGVLWPQPASPCLHPHPPPPAPFYSHIQVNLHPHPRPTGASASRWDTEEPLAPAVPVAAFIRAADQNRRACTGYVMQDRFQITNCSIYNS